MRPPCATPQRASGVDRLHGQFRITVDELAAIRVELGLEPDEEEADEEEENDDDEDSEECEAEDD